jgi:hypothetical protein
LARVGGRPGRSAAQLGSGRAACARPVAAAFGTSRTSRLVTAAGLLIGLATGLNWDDGMSGEHRTVDPAPVRRRVALKDDVGEFKACGHGGHLPSWQSWNISILHA